MNHGLNEPGATRGDNFDCNKIIQLSPAILNAHFAYLHFSRVVKSRAIICFIYYRKTVFMYPK